MADRLDPGKEEEQPFSQTLPFRFKIIAVDELDFTKLQELTTAVLYQRYPGFSSEIHETKNDIESNFNKN